MKKFRWLFVLLAMLLLMSVTVFAGTNEETEPQTSSIDAGESLEMQDSFFVQSLPCPTDIMEYVSENSMSFIRSLDETQSLDYDTITVGHPFTYGDKVPLFTFPVYSGNKAVYTIRATYAPDGSISGTGSTFLADELNTYRNRTSRDCPLLFDVVDNTLCACLGDVVEEVYVFHQGESVNPQSVNFDRIAPKLEIVDIAVPIDSQETDQVTPFGSMSVYLPLSITETQGNDSWCTAYTTAAIMRTQTKDYSHTAEKVIRYFYQGTSPIAYINFDRAETYMKDNGLKLATYITTALNTDELVIQIEAYSPVLMAMTNMSNGEKRHTQLF